MPVTQSLEFSCTTGLTVSCKLFAVASDTVVATATATEKTNDKNRYSVAYTDVPAGAYRLNGFVSGVGGFVNEVYDLTLSTATFQPRSERLSALSQSDIDAIVDAVELTVLPLDATVVDRVAGTTINLFTDETPSVAVAVVDSSGDAVDLTNLTLEVVIELRPSTDVAVIANANISKANGSFSFTVPSAVTNAARACKWALRKTSDSSVLVQGDLFVNYAPTNDP